MLRLILAFALVSSVAACGTRLNPLNWFGNGQEEITVVEDGEARVVDGRQLVAEVVALDVDRTTQGVIVRAMGRPPVQGYWNAELVEIERTGSTLVYEFRIAPPLGSPPAGTAPSREVIVGTNLSDFDLRGIRTVTVIGAQNRRSARR